MKTSDLLVAALENEGVRTVYGIPGEENLDVLDSLSRSGIELVLTRHEQAAGFMAATRGRLTGEPGVCLSTLGPGATNLVTAAAYAQLGGMPMVMLAGQKPVRSSKQGRFQIVDVVRLMGPVTVYAEQVVEGDRVPAMVREAFRLAAQERPGAAYLELPEDIAGENTDASIFPVVGHRHPCADDRSVDEAVRMIRAAEHPLLLVGADANRERIGAAVTGLVDRSGLYVFTTQMGKGVVDERHPQCIGTAALSEHDFLHCAIDRSDLIVNIGHDVVEKPPFLMEKGGKRVIHVYYEVARIDEVYFPQLNVVGDIADTVVRLTERLGRVSRDFSFFDRVRAEVDSHTSRYFTDDRFPILPQRLVKLLRDRLDDRDIVTLDNGIYKIWFARNYRCHAPNTLLLDNGLATMGAGLPSAIAAKHVHPERKVVSVSGDGGFLMNSQELETAVRMELDLVVIVLRDDAYGMIKWKQQGMGFADYGLDFASPDLVRYAESFGAVGHRAESVTSLVEILGAALRAKGVHVVDLPVDYSLNHEILNVMIKGHACTL